MIYYTRNGEKVTIEMTREDFEQLLLILGFAIGAAHRQGPEMFYRHLQFVNELNRTNPEFKQYEIPEEFQAK
jgi:hypothetical protein